VSHLRRKDAVDDLFVSEDGLVRSTRRFPSSRALGLAIGAGRTAIGATFLAAPVTSVRILGLDTATAQRATWLAQMAAARDLVLGAGTLAASMRRRGSAGWLLAGAGADLMDAAILGQALRSGRVKGFPAAAIAGGAAAAAAVAVLAAVGTTRRR
jgi:hypothetical protein